MAAAPTAKNAIATKNMYALEDAFGPFMPTSHRMNHAPATMNHTAGGFRTFFIINVFADRRIFDGLVVGHSP